jgi:hypothetical protein
VDRGGGDAQIRSGKGNDGQSGSARLGDLKATWGAGLGLITKRVDRTGPRRNPSEN